jgi:hypothetical protein
MKDNDFKKCSKCNLETSNFYTYKKKGAIYFDSNCKDCRKIENEKNRQIRGIKAREEGFTSLHDKRIKTCEKYKEYYNSKVQPYNTIKNNNRRKKAIEIVSDYYIRRLIMRDKKMKGVQIPKELIDIYRNNLFLKRELKNDSTTKRTDR